MENSENSKNKQKWSLLFWIGAVFCFVIFPILLLNVGLDSYIKIKNEIEEHEAYRKLGINLEKILQYGDARHYFHSLLSKLFEVAEAESDSLAYLSRAIPHLKKRNPGIFNFVISHILTNNIIPFVQYLV